MCVYIYIYVCTCISFFSSSLVPSPVCFSGLDPWDELFFTLAGRQRGSTTNGYRTNPISPNPVDSHQPIGSTWKVGESSHILQQIQELFHIRQNLGPSWAIVFFAEWNQLHPTFFENSVPMFSLQLHSSPKENNPVPTVKHLGRLGRLGRRFAPQIGGFGAGP